MPDPGETREELARSSDRDALALRALIEGWAELDPEEVGLTAAKLIERLDKRPDAHESVRSAVLELCPAPAGKLPAPRSLGSKLRQLRGRVVAGKSIDRRDQHGTAVWFVATAGANDAESVGEGCFGGFGCFAQGQSPGSVESVTPVQATLFDGQVQCEAKQPNQPNQPDRWEEGEV
jgi:hypothetical protein